MDTRTLTKLLLKLVGLYWLTGSLVSAISLATTIGTDASEYRLFASVSYIVVGVALIWFPGAITNRILRIEGSELEGAVTADRLLGVGISLLGLYFSVVSISALIFSLGAFGEWGGHAPEQIAAFTAWLVQLAIGLTLVLGRKRVVSLIG
jgi:hypothetical protein